jgi:hypothetical protein
MTTMMRLVLVSLLCLAVARAEEKQAAYVIETSLQEPSAPLSKLDLKRFKEGKLPRFQSALPLIGITQAGHARNRCHTSESEKERVYWHHSNPRMNLVVYSDSKISLDTVVKFDRCFGMRILRGPDGKLRQASTITDAFFFKEEGSRITVDRYRAIDCETTRDGSMVVREGAKRQFRTEVWENPGERTEKSWVFRSRQQPSNGNPHRIIVTTFTETAALSEIASLTYEGMTEEPANLTDFNSIQRVPWPEGPGYRQIIKAEKLKPGQGMVLERNVVESWTVGSDGTKTRVKTEDLLAREKDEEPPAEEF